MRRILKSDDEFLAFRKFQILPDGRKGLVSHEDAVKKAEYEYDIFNKTQKIEPDFDKEIKCLEEIGPPPLFTYGCKSLWILIRSMN